MAVIKCKMCGGDLNLVEGASVCECEYCGSMQTVPSADSEKMLTLFGRANRLRLACEFDKAAGVYESIVTEFPEEAEAYWGLVLCKYGIEYVDDPATGKKIPTCHRSSFSSIMEDSDFEQACENADSVARKQYREEAKSIDEIQKGILAISSQEEPYDIFICYKETAENGDRTVDSVMAQDVYDALTDKGYRVFFSRISLEDKLGAEYEPYIFAALNSAKIMLVFGTDYEYFNAVWVKNEWSRFLKLMAQDKSKHLIPCYKGVDAYDMPKEFQHLQGQDMGKVGATQDLLRGIEKLVPRAIKETRESTGHTASKALTKRGYIYLEDSDFENAIGFFDRALDENPEDGQAYLGKFLSTFHYIDVHSVDWEDERIDENRDIVRAVRYLPDAEKNTWIQNMEDGIKKRKVAALQVILQNKEKEQQRIEEVARQKELADTLYRNRKTAANMLAIGLTYGVGISSDQRIHVYSSSAKTISATTMNNWHEITMIAGGESHVLGLRMDGTVVAAGSNSFKENNVSSWKNVKKIFATDDTSFAITHSGEILSTGKNYLREQDGIRNIKDIVEIVAGDTFVLGLTEDGCVQANRNTDSPGSRVDHWRDIIAIAARRDHSLGLKNDGTVVAAGRNTYGECNVESWRDIVSISVGADHSVGLRKDGTIVATGSNELGQCNVTGEKWKNIVAVKCGLYETVAVLANGNVITTVKNDTEKVIEESWRLFYDIGELDKELKDISIVNKDARRSTLLNEKRALMAAADYYKGFLWKKERMNYETQITDIERVLESL